MQIHESLLLFPPLRVRPSEGSGRAPQTTTQAEREDQTNGPAQHIHTRTHTRAHTHTHTQACTTHAHTHTHTHLWRLCQVQVLAKSPGGKDAGHRRTRNEEDGRAGRPPHTRYVAVCVGASCALRTGADAHSSSCTQQQMRTITSGASCAQEQMHTMHTVAVAHSNRCAQQQVGPPAHSDRCTQ
eukprot:1156204-Pelagomonas_calceolata.AAC.9